jgi:lysozyme family protein
MSGTAAAPADFDTVIRKIISTEEGGYTNDSRDAGGETNFGVTIAVARAFGFQGAMKDLTLDGAVEIYRKRFWTQPMFDQIGAIFPVLGEKLLDAGINMGSPTAGKFLQRALNALRGTAASPVDADGVCGAMTRDALKAFLNARGAGGRTVLLNVVAALQSVRYIEIAEGNATDLSFEFGWQRARAFSHIGGAA